MARSVQITHVTSPHLIPTDESHVLHNSLQTHRNLQLAYNLRNAFIHFALTNFKYLSPVSVLFHLFMMFNVYECVYICLIYHFADRDYSFETCLQKSSDGAVHNAPGH